MNNESQIHSMLTTLESLDYPGKLDLTASFKDVNSSWGIANIINMSFDSSKQGMKTFLSVLIIIITKVKELDSPNIDRSRIAKYRYRFWWLRK